MKHIGLLLIAAAFLAGAYLSVLDAQHVDWLPFFMVLGTGFVGVALHRRAKLADASATDRIAQNTDAMKSSLARVVGEVSALTAEASTMDVYDVPASIDRRVVQHLNVFVANRETLKHAFGLQAFADVMTPYAGGERYLNRVWSAAADGYVDEVALYLPRALEQFQEARARLEGLSGD